MSDVIFCLKAFQLGVLAFSDNCEARLPMSQIASGSLGASFLRSTSKAARRCLSSSRLLSMDDLDSETSLDQTAGILAQCNPFHATAWMRGVRGWILPLRLARLIPTI